MIVVAMIVQVFKNIGIRKFLKNVRCEENFMEREIIITWI